MPRRSRKAKPATIAPPPAPTVSARAALLCALGVFVVVLVVYLLTIMPTVIDEDSGELVVAAHVLGITHPTGYPLWTVLARGFDLLPVGHTSAYRVALLSAFSAAAAAGLLTWITCLLSGMLLPGLFAGLAFGLWFPAWSQAVRAEVYALVCLLFALFVLALWRWDRERTPKRLYWLALVAGFASMHHRTAFLAAAPALAVAFWLTRPRRAGVWLSAAGMAVLPFLCYLYLPIRAAARPPMNWGDPSTWDRFWYHVMGGQYSRWAFANSADMVAKQAARLAGECLAGSGWPSLALALVGAPLILWGFVSWLRRNPTLAISLAAGGAVLGIWVLTWGDVSDSKVWLTPLGLVLALFGGMGLERLSALLPKRVLGPAVIVLIGLTVCAILLSADWARSDKSNLWLHRDRWASALSQMDRKAIFVVEQDDPMFASYYLQNVEGLRKDVTILRPHGLWGEWYANQIPDRELRETGVALWRGLTKEYHLEHPGTPEFWDATARLALGLAQHYRGRRAVYALHGPATTTLPAPPYFVGLNDQLYRLDFAPPDSLRTAAAGAPIAELPGGVKLFSLTLDKPEAEAGELVGFRAWWRLDAPLPGLLFAVKLVPKATAGADRLAKKAYLVQGFPVLSGIWGLPASPPGTAYEQRGVLTIPSNAAGPYRLEIGYATKWPADYQNWQTLGDTTRLSVRPRPLPTNGR